MPERLEGRASWGRTLGVAVALTAVTTLILLAFSWPVLTARPRDLPLGITGQPRLVTQVGTAASAAAPGAFAFTQVGDRAAAVELIGSRQAYGALILDPQAPEVLTASAASPVARQLLTGLAAQLELQLRAATQSQGAPAGPLLEVAVTDVVPLAASDPSGARLVSAGLPLILGGLFCGIAAALLVGGRIGPLVGLASYAVCAALAVTAVLQGWYGALQGSFAVNASVVALALLAVGSIVLGLHRLLGRGGIGLAAVIFILGASPIAGLAQPPEFLPKPWGQIGQLLPPGASGSLLRTLSYFPSADTVQPWLVLSGWVVLGVGLTLAGSMRRPGAGR